MALIKKNRNRIREKDRRQTGSPPNRSNNYSYYANRADNPINTGRTTKPDDNAKPRSKLSKWLRNLPGIIAVLVVIASIMYSLTLNTVPAVRFVGDTSNSFLQPKQVYQLAATKIFSESVYSRTKITIDTIKIANKLLLEFPELEGVSVVVPLSGHTPILEIKPSVSSLILSNTKGKYLVNQNGVAVLKVTSALSTINLSLPVVTDDSGLSITIGKPVVPTDFISFINSVLTQFTSKKIIIQSLTLSTVPYELDVQVRGVPYYIKFDLQSDPQFAIGTYLSTVKYLTSTNSTPSQYIDVRIPGRAYYK